MVNFCSYCNYSELLYALFHAWMHDYNFFTSPIWLSIILLYRIYRYVNLKPCITPLPEDGSGANITTWPARLHNPPERLQSIKIDAFVSRKDLFKAESKYWKEIIDSYLRSYWKKFKLRNVMDMRAGFGGYFFHSSCHDFFYFDILKNDLWVVILISLFWQICDSLDWQSTRLLGYECCSC